MKKTASSLAVALTLWAVMSPALGQPPPPHKQPKAWVSISEQESELSARIEQGVRSGALTRREADRLRNEFDDIVALEAQYRRSRGHLSDGERAELRRRLDDLSARVYAQKHDSQRRW